MKNKFSISGIALLIILSSNLAKAQYSEKRNVDDFTKIVIGQMQPDVVLTQSDSNQVIIEASSAKKCSEIKTTVSNGILDISGGKPIDASIIIYVKKLNRLEMSGTVDVKTSNQLETDNLSINTSGTGDAIIDVSAKQVKASTMGTGDIKLSGNCDSLTAIVAGTGDIKAFPLMSNSVNASVTGSGDAKINAKNYLDANVSGTGDIIYKGNPTRRSVKIEGTGSIEQADANGKLYSDNGSDTTKIKMGNKKLIIVDKDDDNADSTSEKHSSKNSNHTFKHWLGIDIGSCGYLSAGNNIAMPNDYNYMELNYSKSLDISFNFLEEDIHIVKNYINIETGLGLEFKNYSFSNGTSLIADSSVTTGSINKQINYTTNKLKECFINLPVLLDFNTSANPKKSFHLAGGIILGYNIHSKTKQSYQMGNSEINLKVVDDYNLSPFSASATVRAGYGYFSLYATYALNTLFESNKGPQLTPFTVGISLF